MEVAGEVVVVPVQALISIIPANAARLITAMAIVRPDRLNPFCMCSSFEKSSQHCLVIFGELALALWYFGAIFE